MMMMPEAIIGKRVRRFISVPVVTNRSTYHMHIITQRAAMHSSRNITAPFILNYSDKILTFVLTKHKDNE